MKNNKALITGGLGLIGSSIALKLVKLGWQVTILDAELPRYGGNHFNISFIKDKINYIHGDVRDPATMNYAVLGMNVIFNLAGQVDYNYSLKDPFFDLDINCKGALVTLQACKEYNPEVKVLFSGSRMQYGKITDNPVSEDHPLVPLSFYGVHKLTAEKYHLAFYNHYGVRCTCFRIANPYGPRSQMQHHYYSILNWFIRQAMENEVITIFGEGRQLRDYIYVDDIADAMIMAATESTTTGKVYNLGTGVGTKFNDMVKIIVDTVGKGKIENRPWPNDWENVETGHFIADISKIKNDLAWEPKISVEEGIKKTVEYYKKYKDYYW